MDWERRWHPAASILDTAGPTPLVQLRRAVADVQASVFVKLEYFGPSGSIKNRILPVIVEEAERRGDTRRSGQSCR
jgi:cysteine synthase